MIKNKSKPMSKNLWFCMVLFAIMLFFGLGVWFAISGVSEFNENKQLDSSIIGSVINYHPIANSGTYDLVIKYVVEENVYTLEARVYNPKSLYEIEVFYNHKNPNIADITTSYLGTVVLFLFSVVFLALGIFVLIVSIYKLKKIGR